MNIISRGRGQSVVAAAAYRCGAVLRDHRYGVTHNYLGKRGIVHAEIMAPSGTWVSLSDREALWNAVEAAEARKDSQLARLIEVGLPVELSADERVALVRAYIAKEFVGKGMVADFCIRGDSGNPHAHILLTLRRLTSAAFGPKERSWNGKAVLLDWRSAWAAHANEHLARAGHAVRIDHRTLEAQQIELTPGRRVGAAHLRQAEGGLPPYVAERIAEQQRIASDNGQAILEDPTVALQALTHQRPIFTHDELEHFLRSKTGSVEQFESALLAVTQSTDLVAVPGREGRFTSRDMIDAENSLLRRASSMAVRQGHGVAPDLKDSAASEFALGNYEQRAFDYLVSEGDAKAIATPRAALEPLLRASCRAWEAQGLRVVGAAPTDGAAATLAAISGIPSESVARREAAWQSLREVITRDTVVVIDGAHAFGIKQLERLLAVADKARAKIVLIADVDEFEAMRAGCAFTDVRRRVGFGLSPPL